MIVTNLKGNSNSNVQLITENGINFVRKTGDIQRNLDRYNSLQLPFPKILSVTDSYYDIEYIKNLNVSSYLTNNSTGHFLAFIDKVIDYLATDTYTKDYTKIYDKKLSSIDLTPFKFNQSELIDRLPKVLPCSKYFGDLTFDNILYDIDRNEFILIDGLTSEFDSYVFDLHKLKQDVVCKWFIRSIPNKQFLDHKLISIDSHLRNYFTYENNYLTILMLLRVFPYCKNDFDRTFIIDEVNKLWM